MRIRFRERLDGLANPLLVKEMYQSMHSRRFLASLWIMLIASLFAYTVIYQGQGQDGECGEAMFVAFSAFAYVMGVCILPFISFSNLRKEIEGRTIELVNITRISATGQVTGRMLASLARVGLLYAVLGPFAVTAFLFKGVGVESILVALFVVLLLSMAACSLGIFFAALTATSVGTLARWLYFGVFVLAVISSTAFLEWCGSMSYDQPSWGDLGLVLGMMIVSVLLVIALMSSAAANVLTFEADKSSARTKLILLLVVAAIMSFPVVIAIVEGYGLGEEAVEVLLAWSCTIVGLFCAFWMMDRNHVRRRRQAGLTRRGVLYRIFWYPLTDGAGPSAAFLIITAVLMRGAIVLMSIIEPFDSDWVGIYTFTLAAMVVYVLYCSALVYFVMRFAAHRSRTPAARRMAMAVLIAGSFAASLVIRALGDYSAGDYLNPVGALLPSLYLTSAVWTGVYGRWSSHAGGGASLFHLITPALIGGTFCIIVLARHMGRYLRGEFR